MANRHQRDVYCFLQDSNAMFYRANQLSDGTYVTTKNAQPYPIKYNPSNLLKNIIEFGTNQKYNSLNRSISYTFDFIKDGAAILRNGYYNGRVVEEKMYLICVQWDGSTSPGVYKLAYQGKIDFNQKDDDPANETFSVSTIDDSTWGVLSSNDETQYAIECNATNTKAIKVLFDGLTLLNKYTYQTVQSPIEDVFTPDVWHFIPFVLVNQDGDSAGILQKNQTGGNFSDIATLDALNPSYFLYTAYALPNVSLNGNIKFEWSRNIPSGDVGLIIAFYTSTGQFRTVFCNQPAFLAFPDINPGPLIQNHIYDLDFNFLIDLSAGESVFFIAGMFDNAANQFAITPIVTNIFVSTKTRPQSIIAYGLRPLDLLQQLVSKATNNRFTIQSNFFVENNKDIAIAGDSLRGIANAKIYSSFYDFFKTFDAIYFMALRIINGALWMEKYVEVYRQDTTIFDIGDAISIKSSPAKELYGNEIEAGSPKQDYRHPSGRLEFNSINTWSINILSNKKKLSFVSVYRLGCYDITFLILDYQGQSTQDNSGDKSVYLAKITDEIGTAVDDLETFENVTVDDAVLEPIIKAPLANDVLTYNKPIIRGISPPGATVNIYADTVLDGGTVADSDGNWSYSLVNALTAFVVGVTTGIHQIDATYTDLSGPTSTITITILDDTTATVITYPQANDSLFNNLPLVKGVGQRGFNFNLFLDGAIIANITVDDSCKWEFKITNPISNGNHILLADTNFANFNVDNNIDFPLITYIGSELDGFLIINNLPLIKGIAKPGTSVDLYLNYITFTKLNTTPVIADANGDWSYQVVPVNYIDPLSGIPVIVAPIANGLNVVSTSLVNHTVGINVTGFLLSRPNYSSITGVIDNTVFNTEYSPERMLMAHAPRLASMTSKQVIDPITFQTADKNGNLVTVLDGVTVRENANIPIASLGQPFEMLENAEIKTKTGRTFSDLLYNFNKGGIIKSNFRGRDLFFLPIGSMKMNNITSEVQDWKLLFSPLTSYNTLLNLYKQGTLIKLNNNTMYHSDYNTLHLVKYNFVQDIKYNTLDIYDDWFNNRNQFWSLNPDYIQKMNHADTFIDQIITRTSTPITIAICRCIDGEAEIIFNYAPVVPAPINPPEIIMEAHIDNSLFPNGQYFGVIYVGETPVGITERFETRDNWPNTILIEGTNSKNLVGAFFSTGFRTVLRVEGIVKKWQPSLTDFIAEEENGDTQMLYALNRRRRIIRFGTAFGLPDYLGAIKCALALALDEMTVEGIGYTLEPDEKLGASDDINGHPLYYYSVNVTLRENQLGIVISTEDDNETGVFLNVDGTAFGLPPETLVGISLDKE